MNFIRQSIDLSDLPAAIFSVGGVHFREFPGKQQGLVSAGASVLNHVWERDTDALMRRTANRPLPTGRTDPDGALFFGVVLGVLPAGGRGTIWHLILPAFTLGYFTSAAILRLTRSAMLEEGLRNPVRQRIAAYTPRRPRHPFALRRGPHRAHRH